MRLSIPLCLILVSLAMATGNGCIHFTGAPEFDSKTINVQTFNLFNQRTVPLTGKGNWRGDWLFRRHRLAFVDQELRSFKPDVFIFQEGMERIGSSSESDRAILSAGSLQGYDWKSTEVKRYDDTQEQESMGVAVGLPLKILPFDKLRKSWVLGNDGFMTVDVVELEGQPIAIFNVQMPPDIGRKYLWYTFIQERVIDFVRNGDLCAKRVIVAGFMPTEQGAQRFQSFKSALSLKDTAEDYCNVASDCYTSSPENDLHLAISETVLASHVDKILVHESTLIYGSRRNLTESRFDSIYQQMYGLGKLWPSSRFGWLASLRLPRC